MPYLEIRSRGELDERVELDGALLIGRSGECDLALHDILLSRKHCRLQPVRGGWLLVDLESRNGTFVNGQPARRCYLTDGDELRLGRITVVFRAGMIPRIDEPVLAVAEEDGPRKRRPTDPFEALAGTVFAYQLDEMDEPVARDGPMPRPRPAPREPVAYEAEGVGTMVQEMLSGMHDTFVADPRRVVPWRQRSAVVRVPLPRGPVMREIPAPANGTIEEGPAEATPTEKCGPRIRLGAGLAIAALAGWVALLTSAAMLAMSRI